MDEKIEEKDESLVDDVATDDELSAAFDSFLNGEEDVKVIEDEPIVEEHEHEDEIHDLSQGERTGLGRKVAKLHERLDNLTTGMATKSDLLDILKRLDDIRNDNRAPSKEVLDDVYGTDEEFHIESREDLDKYLEKRDRVVKQKEQERETESRKAYQGTYLDTMKDLLSEVDDKAVASRVYNELVKPGGDFNKVLSGDPSKDCSKNFIRAMKFVEKDLNKNPFSRDVKDVKTGLSGGNTNNNQRKVVPKLDETAAEFARKMGMTEEDIIASLASETPMGLRR
jgi:hypothetical protein